MLNKHILTIQNLNYRGDVHIRLVDEPPTGTGDIV